MIVCELLFLDTIITFLTIVLNMFIRAIRKLVS